MDNPRGLGLGLHHFRAEATESTTMKDKVRDCADSALTVATPASHKPTVVISR